MEPVEELRNTADPQLQLFRDRAWQLHSLRSSTQATVSRSTLLYTAATVSPLVLAVLEINGLNLRTWERSLGFDRRPSLGEPEPADRNFEIHADTIGVLRRYTEQWQRVLDVLGLVAAIFQNLTGNARRRVTAAGLKIDEAAKQLADLAAISPDGLVDYAKLGYLFSERSIEIFDAARALNQRFRVEYRALTASQIAIAAASFADDHPASARSFLRGVVLEAGSDQFSDSIARWMEFYRRGISPKYDRWTQTLTAIILRAQHVSQQTRNRPEVAARHLIGALIASDQWAANSGVPRFFTEAGIDQRQLARKYLNDYLAVSPVDDTQPRRDDLAVWRSFLGLSTESRVPRFNAEDLAGEDLLNVTDNVEEFASLVASNRIDPPLSIGLFGDWGSGKSFFMAKMRDAIAERAARACGRTGSVFHQRIVQIDFNAWHYVEANLWASMVEHLFRNLKLTYEAPTDAGVDERREELLKQLDKLMANKVTAEENVKRAEFARDQAAQDLDALKKTADASAAAAGNLRAKDVWEIVTIDEQARKELQNALDKLGVGTVLASASDIRKTVDELRSVRTRTSLLATWVVRQPRSLLLLLCLLLLVPFIASAITFVAHQIPNATYASIAASLARVAAAGIAVTGWIAKRLASGKNILASVDAARGKIDEKIQQAENKIQTDITVADDELAKAASAVKKAQEAVVEREKDVLNAKNALLKLTNGYRLNRFIDERAASDDYRKLLGVLATVRSDFATLSELMHPKSRQNDLTDNLRIDRVILYIDDLDRCEPDRVIEVLQAVHLLLAFKLFVVVVGVDARWVSESLRQKHRALRGRSDRPQGDEEEVIGYAVEPHDYLEKIFQVPFWLDPLEPQTAGTYIANLLAPDLKDESSNTNGGMAASSANSGGTGSVTEQQEAPEVLQTMRDTDEDESDPEPLTIDRKERDFMTCEMLARLVSRSPRTAKRFVNTYRFLRASIPRDELASYLNDANPAQYRCALLMLAIVVGAPDISRELFEQMRANVNPKQTLDAFASTVRFDDDRQAEWKMVEAALREFGENETALLLHLLPHIDSVSRYSFRPPLKLQRKTKTAPKPEYLIRIRNDSPGAQPLV